MEKESTVLLFGSQAVSFDDQDLKRVRSAILGHDPNEEHHVQPSSWLLDTIRNLHDDWIRIEEAGIPRGSAGGEGRQDQDGPPIEKLIEWINTGRSPWAGTESTMPRLIPNSILGPLVVINHLVEYSQFASVTWARDGGASERKWVLPSENIETIGFCTGILSAIAVSCSRSQGDLQRHGSAAIRLAMLIGTFIDVQNNLKGFESVAVAWKAPHQSLDDLLKLIQDFPGVRHLPDLPVIPLKDDSAVDTSISMLETDN